MAIEYGIDDERRLLLMKGLGTLTAEDIQTYLRDVLSRSDLAGYSELLDLREVRNIVLTTLGKIQLFMQASTGMKAAAADTRLAIVASPDETFGLGRIYEIYRKLRGKGSEEAGAFRSMEEALLFLQDSPAALADTAGA
jgi:hypothetical protein